jgi:diketogulonate reductase-like aldo/keto reductase
LTIAEKNAQAPSQVLLRWATQRGVAVIPKSTNPDRMTLNLQSNFFDLDKEDVRTISALNISLRFNDPMDVRMGLSYWTIILILRYSLFLPFQSLPKQIPRVG